MRQTKDQVAREYDAYYMLASAPAMARIENTRSGAGGLRLRRMGISPFAVRSTCRPATIIDLDSSATQNGDEEHGYQLHPRPDYYPARP